MWGGGAEINQAARTSTNHKQPLSVEESVPHSKQPWGGAGWVGGGQLFSGSPPSIAWTRTTPQPPRSF